MKIIKAPFDGVIEIGDKTFLAEIKEYSDEYIRSHGICLTKNEVKSFHELKEKACLIIYNTTNKKYTIFGGYAVSNYLQGQNRSFAKTYRALYRMFSTKGEPKIKIFDPHFEEKMLEAGSEIIDFLQPHLKKIQGIFLFGSLARGEETDESDWDILVVSEKPLKLKKTGRFDFLVKTKKELATELQKDHSRFLHQALAEARPILNGALLEELKKTKRAPNPAPFFEETIGAFQNIDSLLKADEKRGLEFCSSAASVYSLVLRLKTLFLIQCWRQKKPFSNRRFLEFLQKLDLSESQVNDFLAVYRAERDWKKSEQKIPLAEVKKLFAAAKTEFVKTEKMAKP